MIMQFLYCYSSTRLEMKFDIFLFPRKREYNLIFAHTNNNISTNWLMAIELLRNIILILIGFGKIFALFQHNLI